MTRPDVTRMLEWLSERRVGADATLSELRASFDAMAEPPCAEIAIEPATELAGEWLIPPSATGVVLYFHGGGYMIGSPASHRGLASRVAAASGARVLVVDYRLAPEHPFPAAVQDALGAWSQLRASGVPASSIAVGGDSAGGGLALVTALCARERHERPAALFTLSAWTDLSVRHDESCDDPVLTPRMLAGLAENYLAGSDATDLRASPYCAELADLPPLLMQVGARELLCADNRRFAERAQRAGTHVELEVFPEMIHVFQLYGTQLAEASVALERVGRFVRDHIR